MKQSKKEFMLQGLCCPVCANKIERGIAALEGVRSAAVDFTNQRLVLEFAEGAPAGGVVARAGALVKDLEPSVEMREKTAPEKKMPDTGRITLVTGAVFFALGMFLEFPQPVKLGLFFAAYFLAGGEVLLRSLKNIAKGRIFDENFLMSLATIGAFAIGEYPEGVAVMLFYQVGEAFQEYAVGRSRRSISALMDIRPDYANLKVGDDFRRVSPEEAAVGDLILVRPGEKIPLDGVVIEGRSALDTSALTGESLPRDVESGSEVLSGSINKNGLLTIRVAKEAGESTVSKILELVQSAANAKAPVESFITKFARYYTPVIAAAACALAVIPPLILPGADFASWIHRALVFLVVSCPCALVISIPLSFFGGIGGASRRGILVKGGNYLDALTNLETVVFDKTGTLTRGIFNVTEIAPAGAFTQNELLYYAARAESNSSHPIAASIQRAWRQPIAGGTFTAYEEIAGQGVRASFDGKTILAGNSKLLDGAGIAHPRIETPGSIVYLAVDGVFAGYLVIADEVKPDGRQTIEGLKTLGIKKTVMLTGDTQIAGEKVGRELGLDVVYAGLLPHEKVEKLEELEKTGSGKGMLAFVGDGINDAPVLARADVSIAMGGLGSDAAIEAAGIVLMTDEPSKILEAIHIARKTRSIVWQNIIFALGVKAVILVMGALGIATMWEAVFGDVGVAVIAILNAMRVIRRRG
ncbi:MAG: cadmium-translocating P-type ATPase [Treponema sp.]|jgi:Cd2+/Zn2+-exporting ATPase|nr:cadmium-translocating P-type ATPase [Treponema sp.]